MSEAYPDSVYTVETLDCGSNEIIIPNPQALQEAIAEFNGNIVLLQHQFEPGMYGRVHSCMVELATNPRTNRRTLAAIIKAQKPNLIDSSLLRREVFALEYRLRDWLAPAENIQIEDDEDFPVLSIILPGGTLADIEVIHRKDSPNILEYELTADLGEIADSSELYTAITQALHLVGGMCHSAALQPDGNSALRTSPPYKMEVTDFSARECDENDLRYTLLFGELAQQLGNLDSVHLPKFDYLDKDLIRLAKEYPEVDLDIVRETCLAIVALRRQLAQEYGIPPVLTTDDIKAVVFASSLRQP